MLKINKKSNLLLGTVPTMDLENSQGSCRAFCALVPTLMTALADTLILKASFSKTFLVGHRTHVPRRNPDLS